jgi:23S rRNA (cytosine1962-C5)-methyltransferase
MSDGIITIRKDREKPVINQHPWIFSGAIAKAENADDGEIVTVVDHKGNFLARGYWNHKSAIQVRILTWQDEPIDEAWWRKMLKRAIDLRLEQFIGLETHSENLSYRLINAENDFLPGLVVDRYGNWLVLQALTLYIDQNKATLAQYIVDALKNVFNIKGIYERSDADVREKEGLRQHKGLIWGEELPALIPIADDEVKMLVDVRNGHKTGYYLDQAWNRSELYSLLVRQSYVEFQTILNCFSYTGGFSLQAHHAGLPEITNVDASEDALEIARKSYELNGFTTDNVKFVQADVFDYLRQCVAKGEQFDIVVLDPPKFAHNKQQVDKAARGYKDINLNAFKVIKSGGYLMTFSCSGAISRDLFQKIVFGALADSGRQAQIIKHLSASDDHPVALTFPEGEYLKGLLLRVY